MIHNKTQVDVASNADPFAWGTPAPGAGRARRRAERVKAGDYRAVLADLDRPSFDPIEQERHWLDVGEALRVSSHADPGAFALAQLDEMVEFLAYLRLRAETSLRRRLQAWDRDVTTQSPGFDPSIDDPAVDRVLVFQEKLTRQVEARAAVERRMALARRPPPGPTRPGDAGATTAKGRSRGEEVADE